MFRALKKFVMSIIRDRQFWYTLFAEVSFAISTYFANRKARRTRKTK